MFLKICLSTLAVAFAFQVCAQEKKQSQAKEKPVEFRKMQFPKLEDKNSFSMIVFGDPQSYVKRERNQPILELMTTWVQENVRKMNIKAVLCTGDIVNDNGILVPTSVSDPDSRRKEVITNQSSKEQWEWVSHCFKRLDNLVPYILCTGNHDYGYNGEENRQSQFSKYFYTHRNSKNESSIVSVCNNALGEPTMENAAYEIFDENWGKILIISMEYAPRAEVLEWAKKLAESKAYQSHKVIYLTHYYLRMNGELGREIKSKISTKESRGHGGQEIYDKLIADSNNAILVVSGHVARPSSDFKLSSVSREDVNNKGRKVRAMMFNCQTLGGGSWHGNGGDGWLRILEFMPDGKTIKASTYSPLFGISPSSVKDAWRREPFDEFEFSISDVIVPPAPEKK